MDWNDVRYFLALARLGSVRAAGKALGVSHSTVARRIEALEKQLDARLFDRSQDGYVLTAGGREVLPSAERVEREVSDLERALVGRDDRLAGTVAITCGESFVSELILRALTGLCAAHPAIEVRFTIDGRPYDLSRREADVAVRALALDATPPEHLLGAKVAPLFLASYVGAAHTRLDPASGAASRWLGFDDRKLTERLIAGSSHPDVPVWGSFASLEALIQAARAGLGIVMLPVYAGDPDPTLVRLERSDPRHLGDLWLLCHPDLRHTARVQAVRAAVGEAFREQAPLFRGELARFCTPAS